MKRPRPQSARSDRGDTLIEVLVAVVIIGISVGALLGSLIQSTSASVTHRSLTTLDSVLKSYAEAAKYAIQLQPSSSPTGPEFVECATTSPSTYVVASTPSPAAGTTGTAVTVFLTGVSSASSVYLGSTPVGFTQAGGPTGTVADTVTFTVPSGLTAGTSYPIKVYYGGAKPVVSNNDFLVTSGSPVNTLSPLAGYKLGITSIAWWNRSTLTFDPSTGPCSSDDRSGVQLITVTGIAPDNSATTISFAVSNPAGTPPQFAATTSASFTVGTDGKATVGGSGEPTPTFSESGALPAGVTFSSAGVLSGTPAAGSGGVYNLTLTASNSLGATTEPFVLTVDQAPLITSLTSASFSVGSSGNFTVTATGYPNPTFSEAGALPAGVTFSASGVLSGTPAAGSANTYNLTLTASNGVSPNATQSFTLTVGQPPQITTAASTTFTTGTAGSFQVQASGYPSPTFTYTGSLPSGVTMSSSGRLSGTPAAGSGGPYTINITAADGFSPDATQSFTLTVDDAPHLTSNPSTTFTAGTTGTFQFTATGYPAPTFTETGNLPAGVSLSTSGILSGTPATGSGGVYPITVTAGNGVSPNATQTFTLTVDEAPSMAADATVTVTNSAALDYQVVANGYPVPTFSETGGLPNGITFSSSGLLSGTAPATTGTYPITVKAKNAYGTATQQLTLTVTN